MARTELPSPPLPKWELPCPSDPSLLVGQLETEWIPGQFWGS